MMSGCGCCPITSSSWRWNRTASPSPTRASRFGRPSAPVTWGGVGTDAQHAVFQLLHQGTAAIPVEFVAVIENEDSLDPRHHQLLLANCFAQGAALMARARAGGSGPRLSRRPPVDHHPAAAARPALAGRADRLLRASHLRQCGAAGDQSVRPVRGRAGQGNRALARRSGRAGQARPVDPRTSRKGRPLSAKESNDFDLFVIGAGSGGVRASRIAAAHGAKVAVAEEHKVGGTCVIRGCVPKKLLVYGAHFAEDLNDARDVRLGRAEMRVQLAGAARQCAGGGRAGWKGSTPRRSATTRSRCSTSARPLVGPERSRSWRAGATISAGKILIATGARPVMPRQVEASSMRSARTRCSTSKSCRSGS